LSVYHIWFVPGWPTNKLITCKECQKFAYLRSIMVSKLDRQWVWFNCR